MKNQKEHRGLAGPAQDVLPPEFDVDFVLAFLSGEEEPGPEGPLGHANDRAEADLNGLPPLEDDLEDDGEAGSELPDEPFIDLSHNHDHDDHEAGAGAENAQGELPQQAENALDGLEIAEGNADAQAALETRARPLQEHNEDIGHEDDAAGKPAHAGGGNGGGGGKGKGKNKDNTTDDGGIDTGSGGDGGSTDGGSTDGGSTDTGETNTGSNDPDVYVSGLDNPTGYNIEVVFDGGGWTDAIKQHMINVVEYISDIITSDLPSHNGIDDFRLTATLTDIDGSGGTWGTGGHRSVRPDSLLASTGQVRFDLADADTLTDRGLWEDIMLHEVIHSMGFGTLFDDLGLEESIGGQLRFTGENAIEAYNAEFADKAANDPYSDQGVPLDGSGAHWHDGTFTTELLTPYLRYSGNYLSDMTIAALEDLGYDTVYGDAVTIA